MDENEALNEEAGVATPIFNVYRRGYDPEQVDRYVSEQQRRLDEALHRASESERKLAAAVGQLRELHRRVAVYESEARTSQPPALDTLGERVQRILQEAWEGAYNLRQEAEREVNESREQAQHESDELRAETARDVEQLREVASQEAAELIDDATRRALTLRDEMDRRRQAYLERVERDRQRAVSQIAYLYDQRQLALSELVRLQATVEATVEEMVHSPLGKPSATIADAAAALEDDGSSRLEGLGIDEREVDEQLSDSLSELEALAEDEAGVEMDVADEAEVAQHSLLGRFLDEESDESDDVPVVPTWEHDRSPDSDETMLLDARSGSADLPEQLSSPEDIPTGPMEAIGYGYGYGVGARDDESSSSFMVSATDSEVGLDGEDGYSGILGDDPRGDAPARPGLYDAEADA